MSEAETLAAPATLSFAALPALKAPLRTGTFAGITTLPDGTHHAVILLADKPASGMPWQQAMDWAASVGGQLPSRPIAALLYANVREGLEPKWHWTNEPEGASYAWNCHFGDGSQDYYGGSFGGSAVAVRLIPLTT